MLRHACTSSGCPHPPVKICICQGTSVPYCPNHLLAHVSVPGEHDTNDIFQLASDEQKRQGFQALVAFDRAIAEAKQTAIRHSRLQAVHQALDHVEEDTRSKLRQVDQASAIQVLYEYHQSIHQLAQQTTPNQTSLNLKLNTFTHF